MKIIDRILDAVLSKSHFCRHASTTMPRADEDGEYVRCLDCGTRVPYSTFEQWGRVA